MLVLFILTFFSCTDTNLWLTLNLPNIKIIWIYITRTETPQKLSRNLHIYKLHNRVPLNSPRKQQLQGFISWSCLPWTPEFQVQTANDSFSCLKIVKILNVKSILPMKEAHSSMKYGLPFVFFTNSKCIFLINCLP